MKRCPQCQRSYSDETLNFCFDDGASLVDTAFEEPATAVMSSGGLAAPIDSGVAVSANSAVSSKSIAVLPFSHLSNDPDDEFFCDGLAEELLNALAKISGLKVAARTSSFIFKGKELNVSDIGQSLGVASVLEGSVRKSGSRLRITVQLINVSDGYHLWSERYDREMRDIFDVQDEITLAVIEALKLRLLGKQGPTPAKRPTDNTEAYELYLRGRTLWSRRTHPEMQKAIDYFKKAIELDPNYAIAYSGLADCYSFLAYFEVYSPAEMKPLAKAAVEKAMELDDGLAESHCSLAMYKTFFEFDVRAGQEGLERAIKIDPTSIPARYWYCTLLAIRGRFDDAIREGYAALEIDPLSPLVNSNLARALICAGRLNEGIELSNKNFEIFPNQFVSNWLVSWAFSEMGQYDKAIEYCRKALVGESLILYRYLGKYLVRAGKTDEARQMVIDLDKESTKRHVPPLASAIIHAELGDMKTGLDLFEKSWESSVCHLMWIKVDPVFDVFRAEPRFQAIEQQIKF